MKIPKGLTPLEPAKQDFINNPYQFFEKRREELAGEDIGLVNDIQYSIVGFDMGGKMLRENRFGRQEALMKENPQIEQFINANPFMQLTQKWMLFRNPPNHGRLRKLVQKAFTPKMVSNLEPKIDKLVEELLQAIPKNEPFDLVDKIAYPLPVTVISEMLGIPKEDQYLFKNWSKKFVLSLDNRELSPAELNMINTASNEMSNYLSNLIEERKNGGGVNDDIISTLIDAEEEGEKLTKDELIANLILLFVAGHETTTNLISNGLNALIEYPNQIHNLIDDLSKVPNAVEEFLRFDPPVQNTGRMVLETFDFEGYEVRRGNFISVIIGAANRDPKIFENPSQLDVFRKDVNHISFGQGIHFCLGAPLVRLEAKILFKQLFSSFSKFEKGEGETIRQMNSLLRGFTKYSLVVS